MKTLLTFIIMTLMTSPAWAKLNVCFLGVTSAAQQSYALTSGEGSFQNTVLRNSDSFQDYALYGQFYDVNDVSCQEVKRVESGIATVVFSLSIGEAVATATGAGVAVSAGLAISAAGLSYANFWISGINCSVDKPEFQNEVKAAVCNAFTDSPNVNCNPESIQIISTNPAVPICQN